MPPDKNTATVNALHCPHRGGDIAGVLEFEGIICLCEDSFVLVPTTQKRHECRNLSSNHGSGAIEYLFVG